MILIQEQSINSTINAIHSVHLGMQQQVMECVNNAMKNALHVLIPQIIVYLANLLICFLNMITPVSLHVLLVSLSIMQIQKYVRPAVLIVLLVKVQPVNVALVQLICI